MDKKWLETCLTAGEFLYGEFPVSVLQKLYATKGGKVTDAEIMEFYDESYMMLCDGEMFSPLIATEGEMLRITIKETLLPSYILVQCPDPWDLGHKVGRVLREEAYTGVLIQGKMVCYNPGRKMNRKTDPDEWFRHEGHHEALVDRDAWEKVQKNPRDKPEKGAGSVMRLSAKRMEAVDDHFFRGILRCGNCGCLMAHCSSTSYRCVKAGQRQYAGCSEKMFKEDELKEQAWAEIQRLQLAARERLDSSPGFDRETISELEDKVEGLTELRLQKYNELLSGKIEQPEFVIVRDVIGEKLEMAETELGRLKALATDRERMEKALEPLVALEELTGDGLRMVAEAVFVDDEGVRVKLKAREFLTEG